MQSVDSGFDEQSFLDMFLHHGAHLPADDLPGTQWFMPGQALSADFSKIHSGPTERPYMIVAVAPHFSDYAGRRHLVSESGQLLVKALYEAGISPESVYYTTITRFPMPKGGSTYRAGWLKDGWEYVLEDIKRVRPKAVLFLGAEATKMAYGRKAKLESYRGQVYPFDVDGFRCQSMAANSHTAFVSNAAGYDSLVKQIRFFRGLAVGRYKPLDGKSYDDRDYDYLFTQQDIVAEVEKEILAGHKLFAIDVETGTDTGHPEDEYVVSFQWSHGPGHARVIPLLIERPEPVIIDGVGIESPAFGGVGVDRKKAKDRVPHWYEAVDAIKRLLTWSNDTILAGHNLRYDLKALRDCFGMEIRQFCNGRRSWDTMLACHLLGKEDSFGLKEQTLKHTDMGAYDAPMYKWVSDNAGPGKLFPGDAKERFFHGFRDIAYSYLLPYAACDVDATFRLLRVFHEKLSQPHNVRLSRIFYEIELPLQHPLIDIETNGMPADEDRLIELGDMYRDKYQSLMEELRDKVNWPDLNVNSPQQLQYLLYAPPYKKWHVMDAKVKRAGVEPVLLGLTPVFTTGKYPRKWLDIIAEQQQEYSAPNCKESTLRQLLAENPNIPDEHKDILEILTQIKELTQFIQLFLCEPSYDTPYPTGKSVYGKGLRGCINSKGRVCTQISVLSETGRWKHSKPNLANLPKNKESNIERIMGHKVPYVRSGFKAPDGWVIMEADYSSAELFVIGYMSGDPGFIEVLESGHDVHGYNAVKVFHLDCTPDEVAKKHKDKRAAVKTVVFGLIYGLSPTGLADKLTDTLGRIVTVQEAQEIIDQFFTTYPGIKAFIEESKRMCLEVGYVETAYGRRRYFPGVAMLAKDKQAAAQREATNARIQGTVADMLNTASINLDYMRYETEVGQMMQWEYLVGIHDASLVLVREEHKQVMAQILDYCMAQCVPIPGTGGKKLRTDAQAGERWQEFEDVKIPNAA